MKNVAYIIFSLLFLTGCDLSLWFSHQDKIAGNGNVVNQTREISNIKSVSVSEGLELIISQSDREELVVEADDNIIDLIRTEFENGRLRIHVDDDFRIERAASKKIYLKVLSLEGIDASSSAYLESTNQLTGDRVKVEVSSSGKAKFDLLAEEIETKVSSSGKLEAGLDAPIMSFNVSSSGKADIQLRGNLVDCEVSSSGDLRLMGGANRVEANISSSGEIYAPDFSTDICQVKASSGARLNMMVENELIVNASSGAQIKYSGNPQTKLSTSSGGSVHRSGR